MKKNLILSLLVMTTFVIGMLGIVSAQKFINPDKDDHIKGNVLIEWENNNGVPGLWLQYVKGTCAGSGEWNNLAGPMDTSQKTYSWDTTKVNDGSVCLRLQIGNRTYDSLDLTIDNTDPVITSFVVNQAGSESDAPTNLAKSIIYLGASEDNLDSCKIDWNDGTITNCTLNHQKTHQYKDNKVGGYNAVVTITDLAGNIATDSVSVNPLNIAPTITANITAPNNQDNNSNGLKEAAVGEAVKFTASADDVKADLEAGLTCIWTFDGSYEVVTVADEEGNCGVEYTWTSASTHTVDLTVEDKDGGSVDAVQYKLEVEEPEHMTPMQRVVIDNDLLFEFDEPWEVVGKPRQFQTSIENLDKCELITDIEGMDVYNVTSNRCKVNWTPTNDERGQHHVIIKAISGTDYKYYSFNVTVYSWGIPLEKGWNLISIPYVATDPSINAVFADILPNVAYEKVGSNYVATVLQYDALADKWYKARPYEDRHGFTWSSSSSRLTNIVPGYGYWIKMDKEDTLYGIEENFNPENGPVPSIELKTATWNLIGRYGTKPLSMTNLSKAFETLEGNWFSNGFLKFNGASFEKATSIDVGDGYWLKTKMLDGHDTITYDPLSYYFN